MSRYWSFFFLFVSLFVFQLSCLHSTPISSATNPSGVIDDGDDDQHANNALLFLIKNIIDEPNPFEQTILLNQLREYLNRMCVYGSFGPTHAHACRNILDIIHHYYTNSVDEQYPVTSIVSDDISTNNHDLQKRFFCSGFIGCKSKSAGR